MTRLLCIFLLITTSLLPACGSSNRREDTEIDRLWREGYGFNNPNPDRKTKGLPPLNFDGTVYKGH